MKKLLLFTLLILTNVLVSFAQLEVKDTLLLAYGNQVFWSASSELEMDIYADFGKYGSTNLGDNDPTTCWAEGSENDGSGEYILMTIPKDVKTLRIRNGYQKNENIFSANNRPKTIQFELHACYEPNGYVTESHNGFFISKHIAAASATLQDKMDYQDVILNLNWDDINSILIDHDSFDKDRFVLKIKIKDVYKGIKWDDACISDINFVPNPNFEITSDEHGLLEVSGNNMDTLFYNTNNIYQLVEQSPNFKWIIFILMPSNIDNSRAETIYKLYNTERKQFVEVENLPIMYGFVKKSGKLHLEGADMDFNDRTILLDEL